jgi:hypothetical protein
MSRVAELQIPTEALVRLHPALVRALGSLGEDGSRIHELVHEHLGVRCVGCGFTVRATDLEQSALAEDAAVVPDSTVHRLRLGYCGRADCSSRFYLLQASSGMTSWPKVFEKVREILAEVEVSEEPTPDWPMTFRQRIREWVWPARPIPFRERWRRLQFVVLAGVLLVAGLVWWVRSGARIPGIGPAPRTFEVAPGSGAPPADPARSPSSPTPARSFRAQ